MQQQAMALCNATGYQSAGTVEMLVDGNRDFYFLEMNTRLQVEHPVTELVVGEDLVEHMLRVAAGHPLPERLLSLPNRCVPFRGWAMESRIYAEDSLRNFLPSIGPLLNYVEPSTEIDDAFTPSVSPQTKSRQPRDVIMPKIRIDSGVYEGGQISMYYDPMISKLATYAASREVAMELMTEALDSYVIRGVENNVTFLRSVFMNPNFKSGNYGTKFISKEYPDGFLGISLGTEESYRVAAFAVMIHQSRFGAKDLTDSALAMSTTELTEDLHVVLPIGETSVEFKAKTSFQDAAFVVELSKPNCSRVIERIRMESIEWIYGQPLARLYFIDHGDEVVEAVMQFEGRTTEGVLLRYRGCRQEVIVRTSLEQHLSKHMLPSKKVDMSKYLLCPMPGTLLSLSVHEGDSVHVGQQLAVVEAMKMQNILKAPKTAKIRSVLCKVGAHLKVDDAILEYV
jgi:propionyl-CoA carboxylase alpha chain